MIYGLIISIILNIVLILYSVRIARRLIIVATNLSILRDAAESFRATTETLHESEMYYGDTSLQILLDQSKELVLAINEHSDIYTLVLDEEEDVLNDASYESEEEEKTEN